MKRTLQTLTTFEEFDRSVSVRKLLELDLRAEVEQIDREIEAVRQRHAEDLQRLQADIAHHEAMEMAWMAAHKAEFDGATRSVKLTSGVAGYRLGQRHLKPIAKWTWAKVLKHMMDNGIGNFIRQTPEVDREQLLAQADDFGVDGLRSMGLRVAQDDNPYIDIDFEDADAAAAAVVRGEA